MTMTKAIDRRFAAFRVLPETQALDYANDVRALSQEGRVHLVRAYEAHIKDNWPRYLEATEAVNGKLVAIGRVARDLAGVVEDSPVITEGQLSLVLDCPAGLAGPGGHAA